MQNSVDDDGRRLRITIRLRPSGVGGTRWNLLTRPLKWMAIDIAHENASHCQASSPARRSRWNATRHGGDAVWRASLLASRVNETDVVRAREDRRTDLARSCRSLIHMRAGTPAVQRGSGLCEHQ